MNEVELAIEGSKEVELNIAGLNTGEQGGARE